MYYGVDLHSDNLKTAVLADDRTEPVIMRICLSPEYFGKFLSRLTKEDYIAVEASTNTFWFYDQVKPLVKECFVIDPAKYKVENMKTDKRDAIRIAKDLKYSIITGEPLKTVHVPKPEVRELRGLFTTYKLIKTNIVRIKNRIHSLIKQAGYKVDKESLEKKGKREEILGLDFKETIRIQMKHLFRMMEEMNCSAEEIKEMILNKGKIFEEEINLLISIKGISPFTAIGLMSDISDIDRFPNTKCFCSYLRSAPKVDSSNQTTKIGKVNKNSRRLSMELLLQSIQHFRSCKKFNYFYEKKSKGKSKGKVRVALVRKVMVAIYHMLKRKELFYYMERDSYERKQRDYSRVFKKVA